VKVQGRNIEQYIKPQRCQGAGKGARKIHADSRSMRVSEEGGKRFYGPQQQCDRFGKI
jgi:hypothetical protein